MLSNLQPAKCIERDIISGLETEFFSFQDAKQEDISVHFQTFGEIDNINIKTDPATGRSR